ncbi:MAG: AAA family ATPase [Gammaproteobacteria bacterium]
MTADALSCRLLGDLAVERAGVAVALPPSRKTRALFGYLVAAGRPQRRERLCSLLWDETDDPRGALRWSLTKLRPLVDAPGVQRIVADREHVGFEPLGAAVDVLDLRARLAAGAQGLPVSGLEALAQMFRGEFLEGLDLPDFHAYQSWLVAERDALRTQRLQVLAALVRGHAPRPEVALRWVREWVRIDAGSESAWAEMVRLLAATGRLEEARMQYEAAGRAIAQGGVRPTGELLAAWARVRPRRQSEAPASAPGSPERAPGAPAKPSPAAAISEPIIGREAACARLQAVLDGARTQSSARAVLLTGEPGIGKTRLLQAVVGSFAAGQAAVLNARAWEAEIGRPYGPWIDAVRALPAFEVGPQLAAELAPLIGGEDGDADPRSRERLFGAFCELAGARIHSGGALLLVFDDAQWLDEASAELLHYVLRMHRHRPLLLVLAARTAAFEGNAPMARVVDGLRREVGVEELPLAGLPVQDIAALAAAHRVAVDAARLHADSGGNPLYAIELLRAGPRQAEHAPAPLARLIEDRLARLAPPAADLLRWAAVLAPGVQGDLLARLAGAAIDRLDRDLQSLESEHLLIASSGEGYGFAHEIVRRIVYGSISEPRRRIMHRAAAQALQSAAAPAAAVARHAMLGGEPQAAAQACIAAARHCLRVFATTDALRYARRGLRCVRAVQEPRRVELLLDLAHVYLAARRPEDLERAAARLRPLADRALDFGRHAHARLGFHMLAWLRFEGGVPADAQRYMQEAELAARGAGEPERVAALAENARCLALLERELPRAQALALEAEAMARRSGAESAAAVHAQGIVAAHRGEDAQAQHLLQRARDLARVDGDRMGEFQSLEHRVELLLHAQQWGSARALCTELLRLADRIREGSELQCARVLDALSAYGSGEPGSGAALESAIEALRAADAKQRLGVALAIAAGADLRDGRPDLAAARAAEAMNLAQLLERPSDHAAAAALSALAARAAGDERVLRARVRELKSLRPEALSARARSLVTQALQPRGGAREGGTDGMDRRRTR